MFIVLYDPDRLLNRLQMVAWFKSRFGKEPERVIAPGQYPFGAAWGWWHVGFVDPVWRNILPRSPIPPGENPYRDPPDDESSPLFKEVQSFNVFKVFLALVRG